MKDKPKIIAAVGPTATGKSDLAIKIAKMLSTRGGPGAGIISADSRQVYRGMDIGTGKVTKKEQRMAKHYLIDIANPKKQFTVSDFKRLGGKAVKEILAKDKIPVVVGGTGFYIDALLKNINLPEVPPDKKLRAQLDRLTAEKLFEKLKKLDPNRAKNIDGKNKRRLIRALEIVMTTGRFVPPIISKNSNYEILWLGVNFPKEILNKRIKIRLEKRLKQGMIKEVKRLLENDVSYKKLFDLGLEYRWVSQYLQGKISYKDMRDGLLKDIIKYSKRQMTWFKRNKEIVWIKNPKQALRLVDRFLLT